MSAPNSSVGFTFAAHRMDTEVKEKSPDNAATDNHVHAAVAVSEDILQGYFDRRSAKDSCQGESEFG